MAKVKFARGLQAAYDALQTKNSNTIYICTDTGHIYLGSKQLSDDDYEHLLNKPSINGVTVSGAKTLEQLGIQETLRSGDNIKTVNGTTLLGPGNISIPKGDPGASAVNPFKGWFTPSTLPTTGTTGDYCYVTNNGTSTVYKWNGTAFADSGESVNTSNVQSFATSEAVNNVRIDKTGLRNYNTEDNTNEPVIPRASSVIKLKAMLEGVTMNEVKATGYSEWHPSGKNPGYYRSTGWYNVSSGNYTSVRIEVSDYESVRFYGYLANASTQLCYAWLDVNSDVLEIVGYDVDTSLTSGKYIDYIVSIPDGAKYLVAINKYGSTFNTSNFYCYLRTGSTVVDLINDVKVTPVALDTSFKYTDDRKVITSDFVRDGVLNGQYEEDIVDLSSIVRMPYSITEGSSGKFGTSASYKHIFLFVKPGDILYVKRSAVTTSSVYVGFATKYVLASGGSANLVNGSVGARYQEAFLQVPEGANVALIYVGLNDSQLPASVILYHKIEEYSNTYQVEPFEVSGFRLDPNHLYDLNTSYKGYGCIIPRNKRIILKTNASNTSSYNSYVYSMGSGYFTQGSTNASFDSNANKVTFTIAFSSTFASFMFTSIYVTENSIDTIEYDSWFNRPDTIKGALYKLGTYKEIPISSGSTGRAIQPSSGFYLNSSQSKVLSVIPGNIYKIVANANYAARYALLTQSDLNAAYQDRPSFCDGTCQVSISIGGTQYFVAPQDAAYISIYIGNYTPAYFGEYVPGGEGTADDSSSKYLFLKSDFRGKKAQKAALTGQTPIVVASATDSDGFESPKTLQELNLIKKTKQFSDIKWTPKSTFYGKTLTDSHKYEAGVEQTSIPYSNNYTDYKFIGQTVSIHTFMTAVNNPYSLLYTERVSNDNSQSIWGRTYKGPNGNSYYGSVCCLFASWVDGYPGYIGNNFWYRLSSRFGVTRQKFIKGEFDPQLLRIGDVLDNGSHSIVITGLKKDQNGNITNVRIAQCSGGILKGGCNVTSQTIANFYNTMFAYRDDPYRIYNLNDFFKNTLYEASPYVQVGNEPAQTITYNNDICTVYGDKASLAEGYRVVLNYNLDGNHSGWTGIVVYKGALKEYSVLTSEPSKWDKNWKNYYYIDNGVMKKLTSNTAPEFVSGTYYEKLIHPYNIWPDDPNETDSYVAGVNWPSANITSYTIANIDQSSLPEGQRNHALDLGDSLTAGMYKARMTDGTNYSECTYWEIISNNVTIEKIEDGVYKVTNNTGKKILECAIGTYIPGDTLGMVRVSTSCIYPISLEGINSNYFTLYLKDYFEDLGLSVDMVTYPRVLKLVVQGEYTGVATAVLFLPDVEYPQLTRGSVVNIEYDVENSEVE